MASTAGARRAIAVKRLVLGLATLGAAATVQVAPAAAAKPTPIPALVDRITGPDLHRAAAATQEVLARAGVATREGKRTYRKAAAPAASSTATRYEELNLALDARDQAYGGRVNLASFGQTLAAMKAFKLRGRLPGMALRDFMTTWVRGAAKRPGRVESFAPLLLAEMARRQQPPLDLAAGAYDPATLRFSLLEMDVITAALDRWPAGARHPRKGGKPKARAADAPGPANCSEAIKEYIGKVVPGYDQIESSAISAIGGEAIAAALAALITNKNGADPANVFKSNKGAIANALSVLNTLMRIQKLVALYAGVDIKVKVPTPSIEKPEAQQNYPAGAAQYGDGVFEAEVGLSPEAEKAYRNEVDSLGAAFRQMRKAINDCAGAVGLPVPSFADDVAEDLKNFKVKWTLTASSDVANYEFKKTQWFAPGGRIGALTPVDDTHAKHVFHVDIPTQPRWKYAPDRFHQVGENAYAKAELLTAQPPELGTLISAVSGPPGLVDAIVQLSLGWFQSLATPSATNQLLVTEHQPICIPFRSAQVAAPRAANACTGKYSGTFSGSSDIITGTGGIPAVATWSGQVRMTPVPSNLPSFFGPSPTYYTVESGSMHFKILGTANDCKLHAEGDVDLGSQPGLGSMTISAEEPHVYTLVVAPPTIATVPGAIDECKEPTSNHAIVWPVATGVAALAFSQAGAPLGAQGQVAGSGSGRPEPSNPVHTWTWELLPE